MDLDDVRAETVRLSSWAHMATVGADGNPDVVPVWPAWKDDTLWIFSHTNSVKVRNIAANPNVAALAGRRERRRRRVVGDGRRSTPTWRPSVGSGRACSPTTSTTSHPRVSSPPTTASLRSGRSACWRSSSTAWPAAKHGAAPEQQPGGSFLVGAGGPSARSASTASVLSVRGSTSGAERTARMIDEMLGLAPVDRLRVSAATKLPAAMSNWRGSPNTSST